MPFNVWIWCGKLARSVGRRGAGTSYGGRGGVCWLKEKLYMELAGVGQKKSP